LGNAWRGASFSLKFAAVILVAGAAVAVVPFLLTEASGRSQAESSAAGKVAIAYNLVQGQRQSLRAFVAGVAHQVAHLAVHLNHEPVAWRHQQILLEVLTAESELCLVLLYGGLYVLDSVGLRWTGLEAQSRLSE